MACDGLFPRSSAVFTAVVEVAATVGFAKNPAVFLAIFQLAFLCYTLFCGLEKKAMLPWDLVFLILLSAVLELLYCGFAKPL